MFGNGGDVYSDDCSRTNMNIPISLPNMIYEYFLKDAQLGSGI
jgi:hypothetical protein